MVSRPTPVLRNNNICHKIFKSTNSSEWEIEIIKITNYKLQAIIEPKVNASFLHLDSIIALNLRLHYMLNQMLSVMQGSCVIQNIIIARGHIRFSKC